MPKILHTICSSISIPHFFYRINSAAIFKLKILHKNMPKFLHNFHSSFLSSSLPPVQLPPFHNISTPTILRLDVLFPRLTDKFDRLVIHPESTALLQTPLTRSVRRNVGSRDEPRVRLVHAKQIPRSRPGRWAVRLLP